VSITTAWRKRQIGKRLVELRSGPLTPEAMAEVHALGLEIDAMNAPEPSPPPALPPGNGTFVMKKAPRQPAEESYREEQRRAWAKVMAMRTGTERAR
jgi:hypothetical protein